jgi:putative phosphonate metabolism protein
VIALSKRYALYYAPAPESPLWAFGCGALAYDAATGAELPTTPLAGYDAQGWRTLTADPRRYGFHATLKPPFHLADGVTETALREAAATFVERRAPVVLEHLAVRRLGRFLALCPDGRPLALHRLADDVVREFDRFRAPLNEVDRARRNPDRLTDRQRCYLDMWGYPYVFEEFRFHMTLTGQVDPDRVTAVEAALHEVYRPWAETPVAVDALVLFVQPEPAARFRIMQRFPFAG